jgi:hypothetical protein
VTFAISGCQRTLPDAVAITTVDSVAPTDQSPANAPSASPASEQLSADVLALAAPLSVEQVRQGWIKLFDGSSLFGWTSSDERVNWAVTNGAITADSGPQGLLLTFVPFADYELHCEFQMAPGGNSGVFLRTIAQPKDVLTDCYELNIVDEHPAGFLTGGIVGKQKALEELKGSGGWKTFDIRCEGTHITADLDGKRILDFNDPSPAARRSGFIGLQKNAGKIEFRDVRLRPLSIKPIFQAENLEGWHPVPESKAKFTVDNGAIHVNGGPGFLETDGQYKDFVLQFDAATLAPDVNSGLFFRAERGTEKAPSNGYEVQVNHSLKDGKRDQPADAGSGAIFRRAAARIVAGDDRAWETTTLVAAGDRFATWVNGYPVVAWKDDRTDDPNPRKGRRLDAGHLSLQGHDPTTDALFRNLRVAPLPDEAAPKE